MKHDEYPVMTFPNQKAYEKWMAKNHAKSDGIWVKMAKAKTGIASITFAEALDINLCYGWIDGLRRSFDEDYFVQKVTPRREKSVWSVINRNKAQELIKEGRMKESGLAAIDVAKKNGLWDKAYLSPKNIAVPDDLQKALNRNKKANAFFAKLNSQNRYAILYRLHQLKREETKKKKIDEYVLMLERNETIYPQKL